MTPKIPLKPVGTANKTAKTEGLYAAHQKVYPREVLGIYQFWRKISMLLLLGLYYGLPWLPWQGRQAILFDLPARKFHIFSLILWPQDFFFLTLLLIIAGLSLFFFTALAGRLWCGYACPQTVWTEAFLWMERLVEGNRNQQIRLSKSNWDSNKIRKRVLKQFLWISFALWTGFTFVGYFTPIQELGQSVFSWQVSGWQLFWVLFYSFATYGNAGFLREQVCMYMCPYARFQSAMFDKDTLVIAYDEQRGEPRQRGSKRKAEGNAGDCIDCSLCVQVCPTGIDIRDGLQYECIACAACIDVCNEVMRSIDKPINLIQYTTESAAEGKKTRILRPRIIVYASLLATIMCGFVIALMLRSNFQLDIMRDRNALYRLIDGNMVENVYTLRVMNKSDRQQNYLLKLQELPEASINLLSSNIVEAGNIANLIVQVKAPLDAIKQRSQTIHFELTEKYGDKPEVVVEKSHFFAPAPETSQIGGH